MHLFHIGTNVDLYLASTIHFDEIAKEKIFHAIDCIKPSTLKELMKEGYVNLKNRLGRRPILLDFYENAEMDPLVIIKEYKTYYSFKVLGLIQSIA